MIHRCEAKLLEGITTTTTTLLLLPFHRKKEVYTKKNLNKAKRVLGSKKKTMEAHFSVVFKHFHI